MGYLVGFTGSHRVGKTALMKALLEAVPKLQSVQSDVAGVLAKRGTNAKIEVPFQERLVHQRAILDYHVGIWRKALEGEGTFITDRTPMCFITYTLYDLPRNITAHEEKLLNSYIEDCFEILNWFKTVFLVQPGIPLIPADTSAGATYWSLEKFNSILLDVVSKAAKVSSATVNVLDRNLIVLKEREEHVRACLTFDGLI